jgi:hypothetical protein
MLGHQVLYSTWSEDGIFSSIYMTEIIECMDILFFNISINRSPLDYLLGTSSLRNSFTPNVIKNFTISKKVT